MEDADADGLCLGGDGGGARQLRGGGEPLKVTYIQYIIHLNSNIFNYIYIFQIKNMSLRGGAGAAGQAARAAARLQLPGGGGDARRAHGGGGGVGGARGKSG